MKSPRSVLSPLRHPLPQRAAEPHKFQRSHVCSFPMDHEIVLPKIYIPPGYAGHRPMLQFQHATSFSHMVANAVDDFLEVQSSVTGRQINRAVEDTYNHDAREDVYTTRHWKPKAEFKSPLSTFKNSKIDLPQNLQRNAVPGYTGFIPRYHSSTGASFAPRVKESMDEFDRSQVGKIIVRG
ncbi:protein FAM166A [Bufo gargarizans]|uniref:protein FAM166A n=1 Tax=Bufo gargarizans TaxID=30331 RepID=UPI001CF5B3F0|nr:protein FAM166A [Bufo gargarizans]